MATIFSLKGALGLLKSIDRATRELDLFNSLHYEANIIAKDIAK